MSGSLRSSVAAAVPDWPARRVAVVVAVLCVLALGLHICSILWPTLYWDDFQILAGSWTWEAAWQNLSVPFNEHVMPLGRISTWVLVQIAGRPTALPLAAALQGPLAVLGAMLLVYFFVRRELGHSLYGLVAMALFGVSTRYWNAVQWFAASFAVLALDTFLLALLAAQAWRKTGRVSRLVMCGVATALAPCWFASGVLAGPWCALYLLPWPRDGADEPLLQWRRWLPALVPVLGTAVFLGISLPLSGEQIMHTEHYWGKTAVEASDPWDGLKTTGRSVVDNLVLGFWAIPDRVYPVHLVGIVLGALTAALVWWWLGTPARRLLLLGLALIVGNYWLTFTARAGWSYEEYTHGWTRYHLFPQLGLAWVICAGLPRWQERLLAADGVLGHLRGWQVRTGPLLIGLMTLLFLGQLPRGVQFYDNTQQLADLREVEMMDRRCREGGISAEQARAVLRQPDDEVCHSSPKVSRWDFLWGSDQPVSRTDEEVRRYLQ